MVFTDYSGVVDDNRGAYRRQFYYLVLNFFSTLAKSYVRGKSSIAVRTYVFDGYTEPMDRYMWAGDIRQNSHFFLSYKIVPRKKTYGTSINEIYRSALRMINDYAVTCRNFETYTLLVCDGGTEDYDGAPNINVWQAELKQLVSRLKSKNVVFLLAGAANIEPIKRPKLLRKGINRPCLQIHEEMWSGYSLARGFDVDSTPSFETDLIWFMQKFGAGLLLIYSIPK